MQNKISILVVEDEALIAENLKLTLEDFDFEVKQVCYSFDEAITALKSHHCDMALLDINLGDTQGRTGLDLAKFINTHKKIPFLFLTAFCDKETITIAAALNPAGYLVKPVNGISVFAAVQTGLSNFSLQQKALLPQEPLPGPAFFYSKLGSQLYKVAWQEVYAIVATKNYVKLLTEKNTVGYLMRLSLQQALQAFVPQALRAQFIQVSRNTAIQKSIIKIIKENSVVTEYGEFELTRQLVDVL